MIEIKLHFVILDEAAEESKDASTTGRIQIVRDYKDLSALLGSGTMSVEPIE